MNSCRTTGLLKYRCGACVTDARLYKHINRSFSSLQFNRFAQMLAMSCVCWCCVCDAHHLSFNSKTVNSQAPISTNFEEKGV